jgi:hypothetical protein
MRLKLRLFAFSLFMVSLVPGSALAGTPDGTPASDSRIARERIINPAAGVHEPASLFLLGVGFVVLGFGVAAASRRQTAEPDTAPAWTLAVPAEE